VRHQGLAAVAANRPVRISGRINRATIALTPRRARTRVFGAMNKSMADQITTASDSRTSSVESHDRPVA